MTRIIIPAILIVFISVSGCSFFMKDYDTRNEQKLAELSEENRNLTVKVKNLERRVPDMSKQLNQLDNENRKLKDDVAAIDKKLSVADITFVDGDITTAQEAASPETAPAPAPAPAPESATENVEDPFNVTSYEESSPPKPEPQASAKLTAAGAKLLEMAKKQEGSGDELKTESFTEVAIAPEVEKTPEAQAAPEAQTAQKSQVEAPPAAEATTKPTPKSEEAAPKSALTSEGAKLLAMAKGESVPSASETKASPAPNTQKEAKLKQIAKTKTQPAASPQTSASAQAFKLKVLSGTGSITAAHAMAKKLKGMGFEAEKKALAPRADFKENVVYYSKGYEKTADDLKSKLGGTTTVKPLSWNSEFDIIVVSVE